MSSLGRLDLSSEMETCPLGSILAFVSFRNASLRAAVDVWDQGLV